MFKTKVLTNPFKIGITALIGLWVCFLTSCDKKNEDIGIYEPDSIKYQLQEVTTIENHVFSGVYSNTGRTEPITVNLEHENEITYTTLFSLPLQIKGIKAPFPLISPKGELVSLSNDKFICMNEVPFSLKDTVPIAQTFEVPANETYKLEIINIGYQVSATFQTETSNTASNHLSGNWQGTIYTQTKSVILNERNDTINITLNPINYSF